MKEAIGNSFIFYIVIIFVFIFIALFVTSTSYTKAFKVKNKIINILEKYGDDAITESGNLKRNVKNEIEDNLSLIGYRIRKTGEKSSCQDYFTKHNLKEDTKYLVSDEANKSADYDYCIAKFDTTKGSYYGVVTYMYLDLPIIGSKISIPIYGETKVMGLVN